MENKAYINFRAHVHKKSVDVLMRIFGELMSKNIKDVTLIVSSSGGRVQPALDFYDFAKGLPITITTYTIGQVASAAIVIYCVAEKRYTHSRSKFLIHGIRGGAQGYSIKDMKEKIMPNLTDQSNKIAEIIAEATKKDKLDVEKDMTGEKELSAEKAIEYGLVTVGIDDQPIKMVGAPIITIGDDLFKDRQ